MGKSGHSVRGGAAICASHDVTGFQSMASLFQLNANGYLFQTSIYFLKAPTFDEQTKEI